MAFRYVAIALLLWSLAYSVRTDDGSGLDPNGGRRDAGCLIDPNGCTARTLANGDEGNGFDPHG